MSFKDETRFRHYMIDQLANGNYQILGENQEHKSLIDLIQYYKLVGSLPDTAISIFCCPDLFFQWEF